MSAAFPPVLSPNLQVKAREPTLFDDDALLKAQALKFPSLHQFIKENAPASPIQMKQKDIDEVLTTIVSFPLSPVLGGFAQPIETPPELP